ncbi:MAG: AzlD domain-containing protein [Thermaerobacter sp.]|nr:AzlD domain-containing protein [Thermaerobacter sp.]
MTGQLWFLLLGLTFISYGQRVLPWVAASRFRMSSALVSWLNHVAPAAFATLMVADLPHLAGIDLGVVAAALTAGLATRNLGVAVLSGVVVGALGGR